VRCVVADTGPLLHLQEAEVLEMLRLIGEVYIPPAVNAEMSALDSTWPGQRPPWIKVQAPTEPFVTAAAVWQQAELLDPGEAEALALAQQLQADWYLTDDTAARVVAQAQGIEVHGSLGVVLWAAAMGHFGQVEAEAALDRLALSSLWLSAKVLAQAQAALQQLFS
jgi:predicted nucleic acid-binding protein